MTDHSTANGACEATRNAKSTTALDNGNWGSSVTASLSSNGSDDTHLQVPDDGVSSKRTNFYSTSQIVVSVAENEDDGLSALTGKEQYVGEMLDDKRKFHTVHTVHRHRCLYDESHRRLVTVGKRGKIKRVIAIPKVQVFRKVSEGQSQQLEIVADSQPYRIDCHTRDFVDQWYTRLQGVKLQAVKEDELKYEGMPKYARQSSPSHPLPTKGRRSRHSHSR